MIYTQNFMRTSSFESALTAVMNIKKRLGNANRCSKWSIAFRSHAWTLCEVFLSHITTISPSITSASLLNNNVNEILCPRFFSACVYINGSRHLKECVRLQYPMHYVILVTKCVSFWWWGRRNRNIKSLKYPQNSAHSY